MDAVETAQRLADEVLFPAALATDAAGAIPLASLDVLADAGLYGAALPDDLEVTCAVLEALAGGCLSTAFVWIQHLGVLRAAMFSEQAHVREEWSEPLARGERRGGLALGGALPGPPLVTGRETNGGWLLDGCSPWLSGWGRIDVVHTGARTEDGRLVWLFVDAEESDTLRVELHELMALRATATVRADFNTHFVPDERVVSIAPYAEARHRRRCCGFTPHSRSVSRAVAAACSVPALSTVSLPAAAHVSQSSTRTGSPRIEPPRASSRSGRPPR